MARLFLLLARVLTTREKTIVSRGITIELVPPSRPFALPDQPPPQKKKKKKNEQKAVVADKIHSCESNRMQYT